jgi:uncharacterized protein Yka (UPF0111/DUF47 family)
MFRVRRDESRLGESLTELAGYLVSASGHLGELLDPDTEARGAAVRMMHTADHQAEAAAHAVLRGLAASFVTPFDRADVFRLCWALRRATARIDAVGDTVEVLRVGELPPRTAELVQLIIRAAEIIDASVPQLGDPGPLAARWIELTVLVNQAGQAHRRMLLDVTTTVTDPAALVRYVEVVAALRRVVEALEAVADTIQTVVVTES